MNKILLTNLAGLSLIALGYISPYYPGQLLTVGFFATSGAVTNWLAIYMLFERVPGLYGSGAIPGQFEEIKVGIRKVILGQFFTQENVEAFVRAQRGFVQRFLDPSAIADAVDYDHVFSRFVDTVLGTTVGALLAPIGAARILEQMREPFKARIKEEVNVILASPGLLQILESGMQRPEFVRTIIEQADSIDTRRLHELSPDIVKSIVQEVIRRHLGWLVVWGGVFGGLIGFATTFLR